VSRAGVTVDLTRHRGFLQVGCRGSAGGARRHATAIAGTAVHRASAATTPPVPRSTPAPRPSRAPTSAVPARQASSIKEPIASIERAPGARRRGPLVGLGRASAGERCGQRCLPRQAEPCSPAMLERPPPRAAAP
jgi:hypothetical protein